MFTSLDECYAAAEGVLQEFNAFAEVHGLAGKAAADHIGYKCGSTEEFEYLRTLFEQGSRYIHQGIISGRRIAYTRLSKDLSTSLGPIAFLELSDQKPDGSQKSGFDHAEIYPIHGNSSDIVAFLKSKEVTVTTSVKPHHTTEDFHLGSGFLIRIEPCRLIDKIAREEL